MPKQISEHLTKISATDAGFSNVFNKVKIQTDAVNRSLGSLNKSSVKQRKAANDATVQENKLADTRKKHSAIVRDLASNTSTMVGPLNAITGRMSALSALIGRVGLGWAAFGALTTAGVFGLVSTVKGALAEVAKMEEQQLRIQGVLRATSYAAGLTSGDINRISKDIGAATLASVNDVNSAAAALLSFRKVNGDNFETTLRLAQDLSTVYKRDLTGSVRLLGKALQDPIGKYQSLERVGVILTAQQIENIRLLQSQGDLLGAQAVLLGEIESKVGGVAAIAGGGMLGSVDLFSQRVDELQLSIGRLGALPGELRGTFANGVNAMIEGAANTVGFYARALEVNEDELRARFESLNNDINFKGLKDELESVREKLIETAKEQNEAGDSKGYAETVKTLTVYNKALDGSIERFGEVGILRDALGASSPFNNKMLGTNVGLLGKQVKEYNALEKAVKKLNDERDKANEGKINSDDATRLAAIDEALKKNQTNYDNLFASVGENYQKQRRQQEKVHNDKIKQIEKLTFENDDVLKLEIEGVANNEQLKEKLIKDAETFRNGQISRINNAEQAVSDASDARLLRSNLAKKNLEADFENFKKVARGDELGEVDQWYQDQLVKLRNFKDNAAKLGVIVDTTGVESDIDATKVDKEQSLKAATFTKEKIMYLEHEAFKASLGVDEILKLQIENDLSLALLREKLEKGEILQKEFDDRSIVLAEENSLKKKKIEEDELIAKAGSQGDFTKAILGIQKGQKGSEEALAKSVLDSTSQNSKKAFAIRKAFAVKEAIMATYHNAVLAYQALAPIPVVGPALGIIAALGAVSMGMAQVSQIRSQAAPSGARRYGGNVVAGQSYLVGEGGPEVMTASATGQITSYDNMMKTFGKKPNEGSRSNNIGLTFHLNTLDSSGVEEVVHRARHSITDAVREVLREDGRDL